VTSCRADAAKRSGSEELNRLAVIACIRIPLALEMGRSARCPDGRQAIS
jgi:hypothetical protein